MRINYYEFPEGIDAHTRYLNGATNKGGECSEGYETCRGCPNNHGDGYHECKYFRCLDSEYAIGGIKVTEAKRLLKEFGGYAYTQHCERDGGCFEVTPISIKGNNSRFTYNRHL